MIIDSHQHFWNFDPQRDAWISDEMSILRRDFLPTDLEKEFAANAVDGCIAVQADQSDEETLRLLNWAEEYEIIKGVVGWIDLQDAALENHLQKLIPFGKLKGFRHILQGEKPEFMLHPDFVRGLHVLPRYGYSYDLLLYPTHLPAAVELVGQLPELTFILDHAAKPYIKAGEMEPWNSDLQKLAAFPNVYCKLSGLVTETNWENAGYEALQLYIQAIFEAFGADRVMFGSDWPVCLVASGYGEWLATVNQFLRNFPADVRDKILYQNAVKAYKL